MKVGDLLELLKKQDVNQDISMGYCFDGVEMIHEKITQLAESDDKTGIILASGNYVRVSKDWA